MDSTHDPLSSLSVQHNLPDLRTLLGELKNRKRIILLAAALTCITALTIAFFQPLHYEASVLLEIHQRPASSLGILSHAEDSNRAEPVSVLTALVRSRYILQTVAASDATGTPVNELRTHLTLTDLSGMSGMSGQHEQSGLVRLSLTGKNPAWLVRTVNRIAAITQQKDTERKQQAARQTLFFLEKQLPVASRSIEAAEKKQAGFIAAQGGILPDFQLHLLLDQLSGIYQQLTQLQQKKTTLLQTLTAHHPDILALTESIQLLTNQKKSLPGKIRQLSLPSRTAASLQREVTVRKQLYTRLLEHTQEQRIIAAGIVSDTRMLSPATSARQLPRPALTLVALASFPTGILLGCLLLLSLRLLGIARE